MGHDQEEEECLPRDCVHLQFQGLEWIYDQDDDVVSWMVHWF